MVIFLLWSLLPKGEMQMGRLKALVALTALVVNTLMVAVIDTTPVSGVAV